MKRCSASESFSILSPCFTRAVIMHLSVWVCVSVHVCCCSLFWVVVVVGGGLGVSWDNKTSRVDVFIWKRGQGNGKSGEQPGRPGACNKRWRVREWVGERGELFSGHAKEKGAALVTRHVSVTTADTPSPSEHVRLRWYLGINSGWKLTEQPVEQKLLFFCIQSWYFRECMLLF